MWKFLFFFFNKSLSYYEILFKVNLQVIFEALVLPLHTKEDISKTFDRMKLVHKLYDNLQKSVFNKNSKFFKIINKTIRLKGNIMF